MTQHLPPVYPKETLTEVYNGDTQNSVHCNLHNKTLKKHSCALTGEWMNKL